MFSCLLSFSSFQSVALYFMGSWFSSGCHLGCLLLGVLAWMFPLGDASVDGSSGGASMDDSSGGASMDVSSGGC